jgi:adenylate kinase family enzyme
VPGGRRRRCLSARPVEAIYYEDDVPEVIIHRLQMFADTTGPLIDYYRNRGILVEVDANQPPRPSPARSRPA